MFIQTETTPNPNTLKFLPGRDILGQGTADFGDEAAAARSPLALRLFGVSGVERVFLGSDFVTVAKGADEEWSILRPQLLAAIMDHFTAGAAVLDDEGAAQAATAAAVAAEGNVEDSDIIVQIKELLDTRIRPQVAGDGGDIVFRSFEDGIVYLHLEGSCSGCPSSTATLRNGIENLLKYYVPEVQGVEASD